MLHIGSQRSATCGSDLGYESKLNNQTTHSPVDGRSEAPLHRLHVMQCYTPNMVLTSTRMTVKGTTPPQACT